jgi:hypothetical protein
MVSEYILAPTSPGETWENRGHFPDFMADEPEIRKVSRIIQEML